MVQHHTQKSPKQIKTRAVFGCSVMISKTESFCIPLVQRSGFRPLSVDA